jgi:hypothetical protein
MNGQYRFYEIQNNIGITQMINVGNAFNQSHIGIVYQRVVEDKEQDIVIIRNNFKIMIVKTQNNKQKIYINL